MEYIVKMIEARHTGELKETDGGSGRERTGVEVWGENRSFYMLSGFNLLRAIIHKFTEVANQMSVCMCALGGCISSVLPTCSHRALQC